MGVAATLPELSEWTLLEDGLVQHVSLSLTTKGGAFVY